MILYNIKSKKSRKKRHFLVFLLFLANFAVSACVSRVEKRGYMFELSDYELLQEGIFTKTKVLQLMGSPTIISDISGRENWIYFRQDEKLLLFFKPDIIERKVVLLAFDENEILTKIENFDINDEKNLSFSSKHTEVKSKKIGFFKSLFSNVGKVSAQ